MDIGYQRNPRNSLRGSGTSKSRPKACWMTTQASTETATAVSGFVFSVIMSTAMTTSDAGTKPIDGAATM